MFLFYIYLSYMSKYLIKKARISAGHRLFDCTNNAFSGDIPFSDKIDCLSIGIGDNQHRTHIIGDFEFIEIDRNNWISSTNLIVLFLTQKLETITGIKKVEVNLVFEPEWDKNMMSEEAKMELGFL